jgi:N-acetylmuramoyl-L-alanine amidase
MAWAAVAQAAPELRVRAAGGRVAATLPLERLQQGSEEWYVGANGLAEALVLDRFWKPETRKLVLRSGDRRIQVTVDTRLVLDGDQETLLRVPVLYKRGSVMLPLEFVERVLAPRLGSGARFDRAQLELVTSSSDVDVIAVMGEPSETGARTRVRLARELPFHAESASGRMLRLQVTGARLDPVALAAERPAPLVRIVRAEQRGNDGLLFFELEPEFGAFTSRSEDDGRTIVLEITRRDETVSSVGSRAAVLRELVDASTAADSFDVIVLDPGHGGFDRGASASGLEEKNVTLDLALALQPLLANALGARVLVVRSGDETTSAESRAEFANRSLGDVFISLHCNAWYGDGARGMHVAYAPLQRTTAADAALASMRRGVADFAPWSTAHLPYVDRSRRLAEVLVQELSGRSPVPVRAAEASPLEVLLGAAMPAVVIEAGYLTNADDARALAGGGFARQLAEGIAAALVIVRGEWAQSR